MRIKKMDSCETELTHVSYHDLWCGSTDIIVIIHLFPAATVQFVSTLGNARFFQADDPTAGDA